MNLPGTKNIKVFLTSFAAAKVVPLQLRSILLVVLMLVLDSRALIADERSDLLALLAGGQHVALMRHAIAPGSGDPQNFSVTDCSTQRNLNESGRQQARNTGLLLKSAGIVDLQLYTSQWCRCVDTAVALGFGEVQPLALLNSFFASMQEKPQRTKMLKEWLLKVPLDQPVLLVTHQVNITALTQVYPSSGEIVILARSESGELTVVGTIDPA